MEKGASTRSWKQRDGDGDLIQLYLTSKPIKEYELV